MTIGDVHADIPLNVSHGIAESLLKVALKLVGRLIVVWSLEGLAKGICSKLAKSSIRNVIGATVIRTNLKVHPIVSITGWASS